MNDHKLTRTDWIITAVLAAAVCLLYGQTLWFGFVNFDDDQYVFENAHVATGLTWSNIAWAFTTGHASNWHPLTWLSHMLDAQLFGLAPGGHHASNVILHAATAVLLFVAVFRMTGQRWPSAVVTALFAFHPLRAESVAWVSERKDVLSGLFFALTLLCYNNYVRSASPRRYAVVAGTMLLGLLAKPMLVTTPFVLLLLDFWPLARIRTWRDCRARLFEKLPLLAICVASAIVTFGVQNAGRSVARIESITLGQRLPNAAVSVIEYLRDTVWPTGLAFFYPHPYSYPGGAISSGAVIGACAVLAVISLLSILAWRRAPWVGVGWFWYVGMLVPVIGIVQVGSQSHADRYTYLPVIGLTLAAVFSVAAIVRDSPVGRAIAGVVSAIVLIALGTASYQQIGTWRDTETLMLHAIAVVPNNYAAHNNLGHELDRRGDSAGAEREYREVLRIRPNDAIAMNNLAVRLAARGDTPQAKPLYRNAIRSDPTYAPAYVQLANIYAREGRPNDAIMLYQQAIRRDPTLPEAYHNYAVTLAEGGELTEAIKNWDKALELNPAYGDAHHAYGLALIMVGRTQDGIAELKGAIKVDPGRVDSRVRLSWILATHPNPNVRDPAFALELATQAQKLSSDPDATTLDTLAAAQAAAGQYAAAVESAAAAARLAGDSRLAASIVARQKLYEVGKPYVQGGGAP